MTGDPMEFQKTKWFQGLQRVEQEGAREKNSAYFPLGGISKAAAG